MMLLDRLLEKIASASVYDKNAVAAPAAVFWTDKHSEWAPAIPRLQKELPILCWAPKLELEESRGPAIWIRCVLAGTVDVALPAGCPVVYVPGFSREDFREGATCPKEVAPLLELQYRSNWFHHPNGQDWRIRSLLSNVKDGLGLTISDDAATKAALRTSLVQLLEQPVSRLQGMVDADFLNGLVNPDPVRSLLDWIDDPDAFRKRITDGAWDAFTQQMKPFEFDPDSAGPVSAAELLGNAEGPWAKVWHRFREAPQLYPGVHQRLRQARPQELLVRRPEAWPQLNEEGEASLRSALFQLDGSPAELAGKRIKKLEEEHRRRRSWVWAELGFAPLAFALEQLSFLVDAALEDIVANDVDGLAEYYANQGWRADASLLNALAVATTAADRQAVAAAATAVYRPWLESTAARLQKAIGPLVEAGTYAPGPVSVASPGSVIVFVDGLRFDVAMRLCDRLRDQRAGVDVSRALAALPTVTQTAKPAITPIWDELSGGPELHAKDSVSGTKADVGVLRRLMKAAAVQVLSPVETGDPSGTAWTEVGEIDERGHIEQSQLAPRVEEEVERVAGRIRALLDAGWTKVQVVTDHGWLLLPGGLPKADLPAGTTELKKGRCARLKPGATVTTPTVPWHWDPDVRIAIAPGISCFTSGSEYEHGGVSLQECVVPRLLVTRADLAAGLLPEITKLQWFNYLCRIEFQGVPTGASFDIRLKAAAASTSIVEDVKEGGSQGKISLIVPDEDLLGEEAFLIVTAADGELLLQRRVVIGANQ